MKLRIASYNIHKGVTSIGSRPRIHALKQALGTVAADLVFLQEVQGRHDLLALRHSQVWPQQGQHEFLAGETLHHAYGMNAVYDHGHHGNALISNFPIASMRNQDVSDHAYESRGILHCVIDAPSTKVHCYVVHLGLFAGSRKRQTEALIEAVDQSSSSGEPIIIAGDFNDWGNKLSNSLCGELGVCEVFDPHQLPQASSHAARGIHGRRRRLPVPARTFPALLPFLRLDRIYVRGFQVESAQVLRGGVWPKLSDHAPIVANLALE